MKMLKTVAIGAVVFFASLKVAIWALLNMAVRMANSWSILEAEICCLFFAAAVTTLVVFSWGRYTKKKIVSEFPAEPFQPSRDLSRKAS